jgi:serine/threonine protein kinase
VQIVPGITIGDKYQLERPLARGGMGAVWVARHVKLGQTVAVKFLDADVAAASGAVARFEREARAAATLDTPHVVRVHDYGVEDGTPYLVMELLRGEDLNTRLRKRRRLSLPEAAKIVAQMGRALRRAHEAGIVHRDLKPANVYLAQVDGDEVVKVLDFGIAKETWSRVEDSTKTGEVFGSPHYMSPEQTRAQKTVDQRADVWATGVIAYRMITGRLPFPGDVLGEILSSVLVDPAPLMAEAAPDLPAELDGFFTKALAKKKDERFATIDELVEAFHAVVGGADRLSMASSPSVASGPAGSASQAGPPPSSTPSGPATPAHADTLATLGGPGTVDTGAATLPYRPASPRQELASSVGAETQMSAGATGPSIAGATNSLLPPELAPRRPRVVLAVVGFALSAIVLVVVLVVISAPSDPEPAATSPSSTPAPASTPSVLVEPQRPAEPAPTAPATASATATATAGSPAKKTADTSPTAPSTGKKDSAAAVKPGAAPAATPTQKPAGKPGKPDPWGL